MSEATAQGVEIVPAASVPQIAEDAGLSEDEGDELAQGLRRLAARGAAHRVLRADRAGAALAARLARHPGRSPAPQARGRERADEDRLTGAGARARRLPWDGDHRRRPRRPSRRHPHADRPQPPRRRRRGPVRVVPREGGCGGHRAPRGRERLHRGAHRAPRGPARADLRRDQGPHARDRPLGAVAPRRLVVLRPHGRGQAVRHPVPRAARLAPTTGRRPELSPDVAVPGEQVLLDGNVEAEGHEFFSLGSFEVSNDGTRMLYGVDVAGDERYTVRVRDLVTGEQLARRDPRHVRRRDLLARRPVHRLHDRRRRVAPRHRLAARARHRPSPTTRSSSTSPTSATGSAPASPAATATSSSGSARRSRARSGWWMPPTCAPSRASCGRAPRASSTTPSHAVIDGEDVLFILHNDGALDFELVRVAASDPSGARQTVIPHRAGRAAARRVDVPRLGRRRLPPRRARRASGCSTTRTARSSEIEFDEPLYSVGAGGNPEWAPPLLRLGYGSFVTPGHRVRLRHRDRRAAAAQAPARARRLRARRLRAGAGVGDGAGRRADPDLARLEALVRRCRRRAAPAAPLRLRLVRALDRARLLGRRACRSSTAA